ncbi:ATP-binding protein [Streptomyces sp. HC44]|uniref:ATP-binding protein n=1 Tax=Streptomyces scabichelini TaxID=2711217 RepID=A0A6G4VF81_9ACTN|nr:ATP-binding protein [Streptomyces scabichelini]NGO12480.1 ATP-binding protein [Streptomyces scabichelini]
MRTDSDRHRSLGQTLAAGRDRAFVGRETELALFRAALAETPGARPVHYLHGPGGIGKSMLLRRFAAEARSAGRPVVEVDGRIIAPTPEGFMHAAGTGLHEPGVVLLLDTFEQCQGLEGWLWEHFLPTLPVGSVVVVAGRLAPDPRLTSDPGWHSLLQVTALRNLVPDESVQFLAARGVPLDAHETLLSFTGGNPLALALAAAVAEKDASAAPSWKPSQDVIAILLPQLIGDIPDAAHRKALEICAHAHVTTESLLRALQGDGAPELFAWLRRQPFVESTGVGLFPHDAVREVLVADLKWRDPEGFSAMHRDTLEHHLRQLRSAPESQMLHATGALIFLFRTDRQMSEFNFWREVGLAQEQEYAPGDRERVLSLAEETEGAESASVVAFWLDRQPGAFRVYRSTHTGEVVAFFAWLRLSDPEEGTDIDPVVAAAWEHARSTGPLRPGEHMGLARFSVHPPAYQRPSCPMTLMQWRATGEMIRAERLAWSYVVMRDDGYWNAHLEDINMVPAKTRPEVGGHAYALFAHDWRLQPPGPWLAAKTEAMLTGHSMAPGQQSRDGELTVLSRPEFDAAVRDALRAVRRPQSLADNPLNRSRLVREGGQNLPDVLTRAAQALRDERGGEKRHRAVMVTYFRGSPTQEAAAARLDLPFSTYRRHLVSGVERMSDLLWRHELGGPDVVGGSDVVSGTDVAPTAEPDG